jgi:phosphatidylglycerol---prolipoprotein diacylglyceryl transferase
MFPILFQLGDFPVYTYGVLMALAIVLGALWLRRRAAKLGVSEDTVYAAVVCMVLFGLLGARLFYIAYFPQLLADPVSALLDRGGLVWYGGLFGAVVSGIIFLRLRGVALWPFADAAIVPAALGLAIGRIGCFMSGCCFGSPCDLPWAVQFPVGHETYPQYLHPTQLYESGGVVLIMLGLLWLEKRYAVLGRQTNGRLFWTFLGAYGVLRFLMECLRADALAVGALSSSQWMSLAAIGLCVVGWIYSTLESRKNKAQSL